MNFALLGSFGENNLGDEAILEAIILDIFKFESESTIHVFTHDIEDSKTRFVRFSNVQFHPMIATGFRSIIKQLLSGDLLKNIKVLKSVNLISIGGGGLFYDSEKTIGLNPIFIWFLRILLFRLLNKKIVINAVGIGPIKSNFSKILLRFSMNLVHGITVRDKASEEFLRSLRVYRPITLTKDYAFTLNLKERSSDDIKKNPLLKFTAKKIMGIQVRSIKGIKDTELINKMVDFIDLMISKYLFSIVLIPMALKDDQDKILAEKIQIRSKNENQIEVYVPKTIHDVGNVFQECDSLILTRYHSIIVASKLGLPFIALSYSSKTDEVIKDLEFGDYCWPIFDIETNVLKRLYLNLTQKKVTLRKHLKDKVKILEALASKNQNLYLLSRD